MDKEACVLYYLSCSICTININHQY